MVQRVLIRTLGRAGRWWARSRRSWRPEACTPGPRLSVARSAAPAAARPKARRTRAASSPTPDRPLANAMGLQAALLRPPRLVRSRTPTERRLHAPNELPLAPVSLDLEPGGLALEVRDRI